MLLLTFSLSSPASCKIVGSLRGTNIILPGKMAHRNNHNERLRMHEMELGATEAVQRHFSRHVVETKPVSQRKLDFEHSRPRWLREMAAEATGVFFFGE